ncbi:MAG: DoxX-like family protein [Halorientalis sp.]
MGTVYVTAGVLHFAVPDLFAQIVPPQLPAPTALVYLSGLAEIGLGVGVMVPRTRRVAAWGLVALLLAVFPANVYMATSGVVIRGAPAAIAEPGLGRWIRLPFQAVLIAWALWYAYDPPESAI